MHGSGFYGDEQATWQMVIGWVTIIEGRFGSLRGLWEGGSEGRKRG